MQKEELIILIDSFLDRSLSKSDWTHEAHIAVSFWFNWNNDFEEAFEKMKNGIIKYNEAVGTINSKSSGYHETMTRYWMISIHNFLSKSKAESITDALTDFMESSASRRDSPLEFYTKSRLFSVEARQVWRNGDIKELTLEKISQ